MMDNEAVPPMPVPLIPDTKATRKVASVLARHGMEDRLKTLAETARSAAEAAAALKVETAAIVKTLVMDYTPDEGPLKGQVMPLAILISGDRQCHVDVIPKILGLGGMVSRPDASRVKAVTGYSIGGVSPVGLPDDVVVLIDAALTRSDIVWAAAGHTHLVFGCSFAELQRLTGGRVTGDISIGTEDAGG